jgi:uncharacterized protein
MSTGPSFSRAARRRSHARPVRLAAFLAAFLAVILLAAAIWTLTAANTLMRLPPKPLDTFSSNILPDFNLVSFPSLNEQTTLDGWFFPAENPVSTIILVHDQGKNRLQFDLDSAYFYEDLISQGYCVLAFDLRNSGDSGGEMSGYGYAEWEDVLAAIRFVRRQAPTHDVLLYGFGTGVSAALTAAVRLPPPGTAGNGSDEAQALIAGYPEDIRNLGFDQSYIRGLLLDTPCKSPDDYIKAACRTHFGWIGEKFLQYTVPYAIRLSTGSAGVSLAAILSRIQLPVFIAYSSADDTVGISAIRPLIDERLRLHPDTTMVFAGSQPGFTDGFLLEKKAYLESLHGFLARFISIQP